MEEREGSGLLQHRHPGHHVDADEGGVVHAGPPGPAGARLVLQERAR